MSKSAQTLNDKIHFRDMKHERRLVTCLRGTWTIKELHTAFNAVANKSNWKNPISAMVFVADLDLTRDAIDFMAGGKSTVWRDDWNRQAKKVWVNAPGYYAVIGA